MPLALLLLAVPIPSLRIPHAPTAPTVAELRAEYEANPLGIDVARPRLGWQLRSSERDVAQLAYHVQVGTDASALTAGRDLLWDSGRIASDASVHVEYGGPALRSGTRYHWRVRVWDRAGRASPWSASAFWETGLLQPGDWKGQWIQSPWTEIDSISNPAPLLRRSFSVRGVVRSARLYVTSRGLYELHLNGRRVSDAALTPGWTSYGHRLQYQTYDVTSALRSGDNVVGALLGDGWYRGNIGFNRQRNTYGKKLGLLMQLRITYAGGGEDVVTTDEQWKAVTGPIRASDIYNGESYDAREEQPGWTAPGFDDHAWQPVQVAGAPTEHLVAPVSPPVRRIQEIKPIAILHTPAGQTIFDLGQNMVGWVRLRVQGAAGTVVTLRHAEILDRAGNFYVANLRRAAETDHYTLKGGGAETFEPRFTFHGFRYVALDGFPGEPTVESVTGIVLHSDLKVTGRLETSNPLINQLQHNIVWGQKGNFVDVPTDCPQRDERLGWTGDAQVFARTAAFNMDVAGFFTKWLRDLAADQHAAGSVPHVIPNVLGGDSLRGAGSAGWSDAATVIPWTMYLVYGDRRLLGEQYPSMQKWVEFMRRRAGDEHLWTTGNHFGDWLAFATNRSDYPGATTSKELIATAYFAHSATILADAAYVLGKREDERRYRDLVAQIRTAFQREFVTARGRVGESTQTAYVLALSFGLLPDSLEAEAAGRLAADVRAHGTHLTTGFLGTPDLTHVLSRHGYLDVAYALLNQDTYPSWLYPVKRGATTIWERWDGVRPDGTFQDPGMNSFNHYAYGAIGDWMYRVVAGIEIDPSLPGYKHVLIQPQPGGGLTRASASVATLYGRVSSAWEIADGRLQLAVEVPANATATVRLPGASLEQVMEGGHALAGMTGVRGTRRSTGAAVIDVGSGSYRFSYPNAARVTATVPGTRTRAPR
ncbi:MAG: glycoside hydrolase family 78 protein [Gemmatimonadaceae bacterium]